jgi:ectoine hydroxylase
VIVYLSLCAVSNHIRRFKRPGYIAHRDFRPIRCLPDDCLLRDDIHAELQTKETA